MLKSGSDRHFAHHLPSRAGPWPKLSIIMIGSTSSMVTRMQASAALRRSCRGLASISMSSSATGSSSAPAPASASASSSSASSWKPPIAPGVEPAYDEALKIISDFQSELKQKIPALKSEVERSEPATQQRAEAEVKLNSYLVASQVNDPEVRWRFENDEHGECVFFPASHQQHLTTFCRSTAFQSGLCLPAGKGMASISPTTGD